jgi:hypothetical protein
MYERTRVHDERRRSYARTCTHTVAYRPRPNCATASLQTSARRYRQSTPTDTPTSHLPPSPLGLQPLEGSPRTTSNFGGSITPAPPLRLPQRTGSNSGAAARPRGYLPVVLGVHRSGGGRSSADSRKSAFAAMYALDGGAPRDSASALCTRLSGGASGPPAPETPPTSSAPHNSMTMENLFISDVPGMWCQETLADRIDKNMFTASASVLHNSTSSCPSRG